MKLTVLSDLHGNLIPISQKCDVVCICGDIVPRYIQRNFMKSIAWFYKEFMPWCESLDCDKVIFIGGNHDFFLRKVLNVISPKVISILTEQDAIQEEMVCSDKVIYLQDGRYNYKGVSFYGTPWVPDLEHWAFYKKSADLDKIFNGIPDKVDVLLTHSPGKFVVNTGVSLQLERCPEYGSLELTKAVEKRDVKYWFCGHIHSGNHHIEQWGNTKVVNTSIVDENYDIGYDPLVIEI